MNLKKYNIDSKVEFLINSIAVREFMQSSNYEKTIKRMMKRCIPIMVCSNSLNGLHIDEEELFEGMKIISARVIELVKKQKEGWAYIKP